MLLAPLFFAACKQRPPEPVAPFGGALAATLPWRDVIGLARFRLDATDVAPLLQLLATNEPLASRAIEGSLAGPPAFVLNLAGRSGFLPASEPLAVILLDPSVHGALCGFAWRGAAAPFAAAAQAAGRRVEPGRVWLPGRGRIESLSALARDVASQTIAMRRYDDEEDSALATRPDHEPPSVRYELVERDGLTLLLPALDGVGHVADALRVTGLLDRANGDGLCLRFELGAAAAQMKDELRDQLVSLASTEIWQYSFSRNEASGDWRASERLYSPLFQAARGAILAGIETLVSVEHLFLLERGDQFDCFVRAEPGRFADDARRVLRNRPIAELLAGAPAAAPLLAAFGVDPGQVGELPAMLRRAQESAWGGESSGKRRRRAVREAVEAALDAETTIANAGPSDEVPFLETFGGRCWIAAGPPPERVATPSLLEALGFGKKRAEASEATDTSAAADESAWCARIYTEFPRDDGSHGVLESVLGWALPPSVMTLVRGAVAPSDLWSVQRVDGGCVEAVGQAAGGIALAEKQRLTAAPAPLELPPQLPAQAAALVRLAWPEASTIAWWSLEAHAMGLWVRHSGSPR